MITSIAIAILALAALAAVFGALLGYSSIRFKVKLDPELIDKELDALRTEQSLVFLQGVNK